MLIERCQICHTQHSHREAVYMMTDVCWGLVMINIFAYIIVNFCWFSEKYSTIIYVNLKWWHNNCHLFKRLYWKGELDILYLRKLYLVWSLTLMWLQHSYRFALSISQEYGKCVNDMWFYVFWNFKMNHQKFVCNYLEI